METPGTPRRSWSRRLGFRISVRGLLVLILAIAVWMGWVDRQARLQRDAVRAIQEAKGAFEYDWQTVSTEHSRSPRPSSIETGIGVDYFHNVTSVWLMKPEVTDETLASIGRLHHLESIQLDASLVTDVGLENLRSLDRLVSLQITNGHRISSRGLTAIADLKSLKYLGIQNAGWSDADLEPLSELTGLLSLGLTLNGSANVTDAGIARLRGLRNLQILKIDGSGMTTRGLESFQDMENLGTLRVANARITSLEPLERLLNLAHLDFTGNPIEDSGLKPVSTWPRLVSLSLAGNSALTDDGLALVAKAPRLRLLDLRATAIGDAGVSFLASNRTIDRLNLIDTRVGDAGLEALSARSTTLTLIMRKAQISASGSAILNRAANVSWSPP